MANEKLKVQRYKKGQPKVGDTLGWSNAWNAHSNKGTGTGWRWDGKKWVQYKQGAQTGRSEKYRVDTNFFTKSFANITRPFMLGPGMMEAYGNTWNEMQRRKKADKEHNYLKLLKEQLKKKKDLEKIENLNYYSNPITRPEDRHVSKYHHYWKKPVVNEEEALKTDQRNIARWRRDGTLNRIPWQKRLAESFSEPDPSLEPNAIRERFKIKKR